MRHFQYKESNRIESNRIEARSGNVGRLQRCYTLLQGKNSHSQSSIKVAADTKKGFLKNVNSKRTRNNITGPLLDEDGHLINRDVDKADV